MSAEAAFVHTFSHQAPPSREHDTRRQSEPSAKPDPYAPLSAAVAAATSAMAPTFVDGDARPRADHLKRLRHVLEQLPSNTRGPLDELRSRTPAKLLNLVSRWGWGGPNLLLLGPTRVGKTSGAALLVRLMLEQGAASTAEFAPADRRFWGGCRSSFELADLIRWQSCRDLTSAVREFPLGHGTPEAIQRCQHARLLVLDDVGATDDRGALERVLNARYERRWPTLTTSGLTSAQLVGALGDALVRRMSERAGMAGLIVNLFSEAPRQ